jgi:hypothetical protein
MLQWGRDNCFVPQYSVIKPELQNLNYIHVNSMELETHAAICCYDFEIFEL